MFANLQQHVILNCAAIVAVAALAFRDQLKLRALLLLSTVLNLLRLLTSPAETQLDDVFWVFVGVAINMFMIVVLILDRTHVGLSGEDERLFQAFGSLSPGEFRRLLRLATWQTATGETVLTEEDSRPQHLFYVLEGSVTVNKAQRVINIETPTFIGEVAFIKERPASGTVSVGPGTRYLSWSTIELNAYFVKHQAMRVALMRLISADMALKVARA